MNDSFTGNSHTAFISDDVNAWDGCFRISRESVEGIAKGNCERNNMMGDAISLIRSTIERADPRGFYFLFAAAAAVFFLVRRRSREETLLGLYSVVIVVTFLCPPFAALAARFMRGGDVYWRYLWLLPTGTLLSAFGVTALFGFGRSPKKHDQMKTIGSNDSDTSGQNGSADVGSNVSPSSGQSTSGAIDPNASRLSGQSTSGDVGFDAPVIHEQDRTCGSVTGPRWPNILAGALVALALVLFGSNLYASGTFEKTTGRDKVEMMTLITANAIEENIRRTGNEYCYLASPENIAAQIRQVTSKPVLFTGRILDLNWVKERNAGWYRNLLVLYGAKYDEDHKVIRSLKKQRCNYILMYSKVGCDEDLKEQGYQVICQGGEWNLWYHPEVVPK